MNFCGGGVDQQVLQEEFNSSLRLPDPPGCGCVQAESEDELLDQRGIEAPVEEISIRCETSSRREPIAIFPRSETTRQRDPFGLKSIEETVIKVEKQDNHEKVSTPTLSPLKNDTSASRLRDGIVQTPLPSYHDCPVSPSPISLNPISVNDWSGVSALFCPTLENSKSYIDTSRFPDSSVEECLKRIEDGFDVRLLSGPPSTFGLKMDEMHLYLDNGRKTLFLRPTQQASHMRNDLLEFGVKIEISKVSRLEVGRTTERPLQSFSIVMKQKTYGYEFFDLEAKSVLEKEVILSSLMVLLDQVNNTPSRSNLEAFPKPTGFNFRAEGTIDQPILCSPSLEHERDILPLTWEQDSSLSLAQESSLSLDQDKRGANPHAWEQGSSYHLPELSSGSFRETRNGIRALQIPRLDSHSISVVTSCQDSSIEQVMVLPSNFSSLPSKESNLEAIEEQIPPSHVEDEPHDSKHEETLRGGGTEDIRDQVTNSLLPVVEKEGGQIEPFVEDELVLKPTTSMQNPKLLGTPWCSDDVCTLALQNIADSCTGIFAVQHEEGLCRTSEQQEILEEYIASALGAPNAVYSYLMEGDVWNSDQTSSPRQTETRNFDSHKVLNRARVLNAQAQRLRTLRNEMTFAAALKESKNRMQFIQTTQSFDDANLKAADLAIDQLHSSPLIRHLTGSMALNKPDSPIPLKDVAFYDSDPEDIKPQLGRNRPPRRIEADRLNTTQAGLVESTAFTRTSRILEVIPLKKKVKKLDEESIVEIVQVMTNERFTLIWHPTQNKRRPNRSPLCVTLWIESGVYLSDGNFLLPKLTWVKAYQDANCKQKSKHVQKMDLLDVCRICETKSIDRSLHPFAVASTSFYVETASDLFLFEAQNEADRCRLVYGLKLVVARLASLLMLRDPRAADEFFGTMMVPGEAPTWAKGKSMGQDDSGSRNERFYSAATTE